MGVTTIMTNFLVKIVLSFKLLKKQSGAKLDVYGKDHKQPNPDGSYKTRPLSNCIAPISESLGGLLVIILDNTKNADPEHIKCSTEEMLRSVPTVLVKKFMKVSWKMSGLMKQM